MSDPISKRTDSRLLSTLEQLFRIEGLNVATALSQASDLISATLKADKVDAFLYDPASSSLVAGGARNNPVSGGTSNTPMGNRQAVMGLNRQPVANGGRIVQVFETGESFRTGHTDLDEEDLIGVRQGLGVRSTIAVPFGVNGERRGVLVACSAQTDAFTEDDLIFLEAAAHWVGALTHRSELVEHVAQTAVSQARQIVAEELVNTLAHDLRNHITPLKGRLDLIRFHALRTGNTADLHDVDAATHGVDRLHALIRDLLDVGRLDQGIFQLTQQPVDLVGLVEETADIWRSKDAVIYLSTPEELVVDVDPERIR